MTREARYSNTRRPRPALAALALAALVAVAATGCGAAAGRAPARSASPTAVRWSALAHVRAVVDLTASRGDGQLIVADDGRLSLWRPGHPVASFARGPGGYSNPGGEEPYLALSTGQRVRSGRCAFPPDTAYVLSLDKSPGVVTVDSRGLVRPFTALPGGGLLDGIAFDGTGRFGHRLLVTRTAGSATTVFAIDCRGAVQVVTRSAPKVEGGIAVAPSTFGRFAGQLIAPDENSGRIFAIAASGRSGLVADSGLTRGGDVGVESGGFVPRPLGGGTVALLADRLTPGNAHPGDDVILGLGASALRRAGVGPGDLLIATEGGAATDAVRCRRACLVRHVADGPAIAHAEGHIVFARGA